MTAPTTLSTLRAATPASATPKRSMAEIQKMPKERQFPAMLESLSGEIKRALPAHLNPERMARIALTCFRTTPKLATCEPASVFAAVLQASQLGLEPGLLGQCFLIPYGGQCQLQIGYQGLVDLARRSGRIVSLEAHAVYTNDKFKCTFGMSTSLEHEPNFDGDRGEIRLFYAVAHLKDGGTHVEVMGRAEIDAIRDRSQNVQNARKYNKQTPWDTDYAQMGIKTVLRRISKFLPKSVELAQAIALDEAASMGRAQDLGIDDAIDGTWTPVSDYSAIPSDDSSQPTQQDPPTQPEQARAEPAAEAAEPETSAEQPAERSPRRARANME